MLMPIEPSPVAGIGRDSNAEIQRQFYAKTSNSYDEQQTDEDDYAFALRYLTAVLDFFEIKSILDVGAGTGRVERHMKAARPDIAVVGIEPVKELREVGYRRGLTQDELQEGNGLAIKYGAGEFDLCCEFGVLHHTRYPHIVVDEMLRVARKGIFIVDYNNFGCGSFLSRSLKQLINAAGMWKAAVFIKTRGKGYDLSDDDGLSYSYSVFNNYAQIAKKCRVYVLNLSGSGINPYRTAGHVALLGIKQRSE
ncbi:MAG: class I SAM-dependent methyltransferase [Alphaproteobacteria bacterium]